MNVRRFITFSKTALPVFVAAFALPAFAADVTFTTTGTFGCGTATVCTGDGTNTMTIANDGNSITINATGESYVNFPAGVAGSDDANVVQFRTLSTNSNLVTTDGASFTLSITQTAPPPTASGSLTGAFSGKISTSKTTTFITFADTSLVLNNITYTLDSSTWSIPNSGLGGTIGMVTETATVTPEPTFMMLTGLGFAGLAFVAYRRRRTV